MVSLLPGQTQGGPGRPSTAGLSVMMEYGTAFRGPLVPFLQSRKKKDAPFHILNHPVIRKAPHLTFLSLVFLFLSKHC